MTVLVETVPFDSLLLAITKQRMKAWGWRSHFLSAVAIQVAEHGGVPVSDNDLKKWRLLDAVPLWAVEQVRLLSFATTSVRVSQSTSWTRREILFLVRQYENNRGLTMDELGELCTARFRRRITTGSVKGQLDRERRRQNIDSPLTSRIEDKKQTSLSMV